MLVLCALLRRLVGGSCSCQLRTCTSLEEKRCVRVRVCVRQDSMQLSIKQLLIPISLPSCLLQIKKGPEKGRIIEVVKRKIPVERFTGVSFRYRSIVTVPATSHHITLQLNVCMLTSHMSCDITPSPLPTTHPHPPSPYQDDFMVLHIKDEYDTVVQTVFKTEFITLLSEKYQKATRQTLRVDFGAS